jgi:hypothetical protein
MSANRSVKHVKHLHGNNEVMCEVMPDVVVMMHQVIVMEFGHVLWID